MRAKRTNHILYLRADEVEPHPSAQRVGLVPASLKRIMANFNPDAVGTIHVVLLEGKYWIIDGMHRWTAIRRLGFDTLKIRCEVHSNITDNKAASERFLQLNDRAIVDQFSKWNNEVQARDPDALGAKETVESFGLTVDATKKDGTVSCPATLKRIQAKTDGPEVLKDTLAVLTGAYGNVSAGTDAKLIDGVAIVVGRFNGDLDRDALTRRLAKYPGGASAILGNGRGLSKMRRWSVARGVAEVVLDSYNVGRREDNRLSLA